MGCKKSAFSYWFQIYTNDLSKKCNKKVLARKPFPRENLPKYKKIGLLGKKFSGSLFTEVTCTFLKSVSLNLQFSKWYRTGA
jgi:hypothetical protein